MIYYSTHGRKNIPYFVAMSGMKMSLSIACRSFTTAAFSRACVFLCSVLTVGKSCTSPFISETILSVCELERTIPSTLHKCWIGKKRRENLINVIAHIYMYSSYYSA